MLPRQNRLKDESDFDRIFKNGRKISTPLFLLAYFYRNDAKPTRIGVVASKKVGGAVQRNRAKRLLRAASKSIISLHPTGFDYVLLANTSTLTNSSTELSSKICNLLESKSL